MAIQYRDMAEWKLNAAPYRDFSAAATTLL
jgi:hypothetical protein